MKVVGAAEVGPEQWDDACRKSGWAWLFHHSGWLTLEERFFGHRSLSFALLDGDAVIGVHPLYRSDVGIGWIEKLLHSGIHRHTGLALIDDLSAATVSEAWALAMGHVMDTARTEDADRIQLNSQNLCPYNLDHRRQEIPVWVRDYEFELGLNFGPNGMLPVPGMSTCCADQIVALGPAAPELFSGLDNSCRRAVRKAQAAGLEFEASGVADVVAAYWELAQLAAQRTGEQLPSPEYFEFLDLHLRPRGHTAMLFARDAGRRVAGLLLAIDKTAVSYLGGVSNPDYLPMRVNDFLHWSAMLWAKEQGHRHYRFGPAFPEVPADWPIARVSRFKQKFGAHSATTIQGSKFLKPEKYLEGGVAHLSRLCAPLASPR